MHKQQNNHLDKVLVINSPDIECMHVRDIFYFEKGWGEQVEIKNISEIHHIFLRYFQFLLVPPSPFQNRQYLAHTFTTYSRAEFKEQRYYKYFLTEQITSKDIDLC